VKIMVDENIPLMTVAELRAAGHDVQDVRGTPEEGIPDHALWSSAQGDKRLLVTTDKGFAHRREEPHFGILIIRGRRTDSWF
jgi:predicted nuclease of predicted toxin-antitoxin system